MDPADRSDGIDFASANPRAYMQSLRGERISMIFQEPNAALNPTMSIGDQVGESFLFHQKKEMSAGILAGLKVFEYQWLKSLVKISTAGLSDRR